MTSTEPRPDILTDRLDDPLGEELLLQAVRDGSNGAFAILYASYRPFAVGIALRALARPDASMAEDVAEVSFIRVLTALRNGKGPTDSLRSYLTTTVRREAWRAQRRYRRQAEVVDLWAADEARATLPEGDVASGTEDLGSHALLSEAFGGLSDRWRHVLWLTEVEGRKPADVAPMLGVSAGSASALAYRARNGLIAAYVAAYRRATTDECCVAISERLGAFVAGGSETASYPDVVAHLEECRRCREVSRGVDVLGASLAGLAPFGLLAAGLWAKAAVGGSAALAGAGAGAGAGAAVGAVAGGVGGTTGSAGGVGATGLVVAVAGAVAVVGVLVGAVAFGMGRTGPPESSAPVPAPQAARTTLGASAPPPTRAGSVVLTVPVLPSPSPSLPVPGSTTSTPATPAPPNPLAPPNQPRVPASPVTTTSRTAATSTTATAPSTSTSTTSTSTTAPTSTSTTLLEPEPPAPARLSGRATTPHPDIDGAMVPVSGVVVVAYDRSYRRVVTGTTGSDGTWALKDLPAGRYFVVAYVSSQYRQASGVDPWIGGPMWVTMLGAVDLDGRDLDLIDLVLVER